MMDLYWQSPGKKAKSATPYPFSSEAEFEQVVFDSSELFEDIFRLRRQVRGGGKTGVPDIIGVDQDGNVCIIEMKNVTVDENVIPQVLEYAIWAETHPDSIKTLWLESPAHPDLDIDWENLPIRALVIAPSFETATFQHINKLAIPTELIEINRFREGKEVFLLVKKLEAPASRKVRPVSGLANWEEEYKNLYNPEVVREFFAVARDLQKLARKEEWGVERKYNKHYCGFKKGNFVVFGLKWVSRRSFVLFAKLPQKMAARIRVPGSKLHKYDVLWKEAVYRVDGDISAQKFRPLLRAAVQQRE